MAFLHLIYHSVSLQLSCWTFLITPHGCFDCDVCGSLKRDVGFWYVCGIDKVRFRRKYWVVWCFSRRFLTVRQSLFHSDFEAFPSQICFQHSNYYRRIVHWMHVLHWSFGHILSKALEMFSNRLPVAIFLWYVSVGVFILLQDCCFLYPNLDANQMWIDWFVLIFC